MVNHLVLNGWLEALVVAGGQSMWHRNTGEIWSNLLTVLLGL